MQSVGVVTAWDYPQPFIQALTVTRSDLDAYGHTNNTSYVRWCEQVAWEHSKSVGLGMEEYRALDRAIAIRHSEYDYEAPSYLNDALLAATWVVSSDGKLRLRRCFQICRLTDGLTILRGLWDVVCIELSTGRPRRLPGAFLDAYVALASNYNSQQP